MTYRKWEAGGRVRGYWPIELLCNEFDISVPWMFGGVGNFLKDDLRAINRPPTLSDAGVMVPDVKH
jgi:hypothetical protein